MVTRSNARKSATQKAKELAALHNETTLLPKDGSTPETKTETPVPASMMSAVGIVSEDQARIAGMVGDNQAVRSLAPPVFWQELKDRSIKRQDDKIAAIHCLEKLGDNDDDRFKVVAVWPASDAETHVPKTGKKGKKGQNKTVDSMGIEFDASPYGIILTSKIANFPKKRNRDQEGELQMLRNERKNAITIMRQVKQIGEMRDRLNLCGYDVEFVYHRHTMRPCTVLNRATTANPRIVPFDLSIPDFTGLYPEGAKHSTTDKLFAAVAPPEKGADEKRNDKKGSAKRLAELPDAFSQIETFLADEDRMKLVKAINPDHQVYAHAYATFWQLFDVLAPKAGDKAADVYAARATLKGMIAEPVVPKETVEQPKAEQPKTAKAA